MKIIDVIKKLETVLDVYGNLEVTDAEGWNVVTATVYDSVGRDEDDEDFDPMEAIEVSLEAA